MKELKDRYIRFDWAIKRLLRQKANFGVLEGFLTVFLGEKITIVELLESEAMEKDTEVLNKFYENVRMNVGDIDNLEGKQMLIKNLYEKFFKTLEIGRVLSRRPWISWVSFIHRWNAWILLSIPLTISCARNLIAAFRMRMYIS